MLLTSVSRAYVNKDILTDNWEITYDLPQLNFTKILTVT